LITIPSFYSRDTSEEIKISNILPQDFILFVGRLVPEKGIEILLNSYKLLDTKTKLVIIGAKSNRHFEGKDGVLIIRDASNDLVKEAYRQCRFAIFPSIWPEPLGTVGFEAMSFKKAVIATRIGGFPDVIINGETGLLVPANEVDSLYQAIKYLLDRPELANEMGRKGYERWRACFTAEVVVPQIEMIYRSLLENNNLQSLQKT
jgi:glycosyltransferase involved in cell wall biosynthesis